MLPLPRSQNPLEDLIETEKEFVQDLKILLQVWEKRVALCCSLPPFPLSLATRFSR